MRYMLDKWIRSLLCLVVMAPLNALAWTALAHSPEQGISYLYYMAKSAAEAEKEALAGCERAANGCRLLGETQDGPLATVVVTGPADIFRGSDVNPDRALQQAMQECRRGNDACRLVSAAWDRGTHIMAVAIDHENVWVGPSQKTDLEARGAALSLCRDASRSPANCSVFHVLNGPGWVAVARGPHSTGIGLSVRSSALARQNAVAECESDPAVPPGACADVTIFHNTSGTPEPARYRELVTSIRADKRAMTASVPPFLGHPAP